MPNSKPATDLEYFDRIMVAVEKIANLLELVLVRQQAAAKDNAVKESLNGALSIVKKWDEQGAAPVVTPTTVIITEGTK